MRYFSAFFLLLFLIGCGSPIKKESTITQNDSLLKKSITDDSISRHSSKETITKKSTKQKIPKVVKNAFTSSNSTTYSLRKYTHVAEFYSRIAKPATDLCLENNLPPAAILAIASLESGWNKGYVGRITGNILSLGAVGSNAELPALYLPKLKSTGRVLFDSLKIISYDSSELKWEMRPPSLKKDYRPAGIAGTKYQLAYFKYHPEQKAKAQIRNINDFVTSFISRKSSIAAYRKARHSMDSLVSMNGKDILLKEETSIMFINMIGGKPNSFNFRKTWPKKVSYIIKNAGLAELCRQLADDDTKFENVW